jgi:aarF domain-containing kinase
MHIHIDHLSFFWLCECSPLQLWVEMSLLAARQCSRCLRSSQSLIRKPCSSLTSQQIFQISTHSTQSIRLPSTRPIPTGRVGQQSTFRRSIQTQRYQPFVPPSPESLGKAAPAKQYRRSIRWGRRLFYISATTGILYLLDQYLYASSIARSLRTFGLGIVVAVDYKLNFRPNPLFGGDIADLHYRNAERLFNLLHQNGGLYLKIGQAIAMQSAVLPPEFQRMFSRMFDDAPQNDWSDVEKVIREDFGGKSPEEVFGVSFTNEPGRGVMEKRARASASVAQVHVSLPKILSSRFYRLGAKAALREPAHTFEPVLVRISRSRLSLHISFLGMLTHI